MNIRECTVLIVRRGGEYLVGRIFGSMELRWSRSPWDAWSTRRRNDAIMVANRTGGEVILFNPVAGQLREVKAWK